MKKPARYNYKELDELLKNTLTPESLGDHMDEIMNDLVMYAGRDDDYPGEQLEWRFYILRSLRNIFWKLENKKSHEQRNTSRTK
jgi:hypothetical protein